MMIKIDDILYNKKVFISFCRHSNFLLFYILSITIYDYLLDGTGFDKTSLS